MANKKFNTAALTLAGVFLATAIIGTGADATRDQADLQSEPIEQLEEATVDAQNNVQKEKGEEAGLSDETGLEELFSIRVTDVSLHPQCDSRVEGTLEPENGSFYFVELVAVLAPLEHLPAGTAQDEAFMPLLANAFSVEMADGTVYDSVATEPAWGCLSEEELLPGFLSAGEQAQGIVVLDAPEDAVKVIYDPTRSGGWAWPID